ncbi:unnamed protein product, partial [Pylaiella littoralis]
VEDQGGNAGVLYEFVATEALELGAMAWADVGSLRWPVSLAAEAKVPGRVSLEADAPPGPQPYVR